MTKQLLEEAFLKAQTITGNESVHGRAVHLSEVVTEDYGFSITAKSLTRYLRGETTPKKEVLDALAKFLGYEHYEAFVVERQKELPREARIREKEDSEESRSPRLPQKQQRMVLVLLLVLLLSSGGYYGFIRENKDCIIWVEDHYEAVACSGAALERPFDQGLLENFRRQEVGDTTSFFKDGKVNIWYLKSNGQLEYFTAPGLHPVNGKTLRPITRYMINKYVKGI